MWSLPDINRLNSNARLNKKRIERALKTGRINRKKIACDFHDDVPAVFLTEYYDIFSEDPKGIVGLCEKCENNYGSTPEGYFFCEACQRLFVENYTWEYYRTVTDEGCICLNCARKQYLEVAENWIELNQEKIDSLTFEQIRKAPHVIAVGQGVPEGLRFLQNIELDGSTGGRLTGSSSCESGPDGGVREAKSILLEAMTAGHKKAVLILDGAYQFSVSIGLYVPDEEAKNKKAA